MKHSSVLIVGCGDIGIRTGALLVAQGWDVAGVRRNISKLPAEFVAHAADYTQTASLDFIAQLEPDFVLATFNPADRTQAGYKAGFQTAMSHLISGLGMHRPRHILMVSSTRVFAEAHGGWVDNNSALTDDDPYALAIIAAEQYLLASGHNASLVRFAGIYGAPGSRFLSRVRSGELCHSEPVSYTNRIHRDDCAGFLAHLLQLVDAGKTIEPLYIGVDDEPAPRYEVEAWLAGALRLAGVQQQRLLGPVDRPSGRGQSGHKRCRNRALHDSGYQLIYPSYKSGYGAMLAQS
ncbi:MAG: NAD(P)H-binding protein [Halioglobus sp.]|nr:NAD(P)H-binding protein [Halioglobus sp.]